MCRTACICIDHLVHAVNLVPASTPPQVPSSAAHDACQLACLAAQLRLALDKCEAAGDAEGGGCGGGKAPSLQLVAAGIHPTTPTTST